ncbi:MAG TPA: HAMP domain-containing sensor histidine kinase [Vicinamibacterales bacterium]|nr:HAMP domain-containing sensor histidine kinase [Vicinamibacterales bacterium]
MRLHHRIVIPFAVIAIVATLASAFLALAVVSREFEARIQSQILNTSEVISRGGFAFTPAIIRSVKAITGADIIAFDTGSILSTTVDPSRGDLIRSITESPLVIEARSNPGRGFVAEMQCDSPCYTSYRAIADRPGAVVAVVLESAETVAALRAVSRTILVAAVASMLVLLIISELVARRVTRPIEDLVQFAQDVAAGARGRAQEGSDEVGRLGRSFNQMLDRLDESKQALVRSEKLGLAGLFAARVAHDIRNPLAGMKINLQLLEPALKHDEQKANIVRAVLHDVGQVEAVIRDLIELARPSELRRVPVDLNAVIRTTIRQLEPQLSHRKVRPALHLPDRLPLVLIDTERFSQALTNVLINASDAMTTGGALDVTARAEQGSVIVDVDDEGTGIDPALADRVFDPFVSSKPEGVGLGLVNAKAVVEGHGGRITLTPRQPRGTRARIVLPTS